MYKIEFTKKFLKDLSKLKSNKDFKKEELEKVFKILSSGKEIPSKYLNHKLKGEMQNYFDIRVQNDFIMIYTKEETVRLISCIRLGNHSNLF